MGMSGDSLRFFHRRLKRGPPKMKPRLPLQVTALTVRLGWEQTRTFTELAFDRPSPPIGGSIAGLDGDEIITPPFPPALSGDDTLFLGVWVSGDPDNQH